MLKGAHITAAENEIARAMVAAEDIRENVNVSVDGLDLTVLKRVIFAPVKMNAEENPEDYA
jgi:hypothetical protein